MIQSFCDWLSNTSLSLTIQTVMWIIPVVQTVHILCVAVVMSSMAMLATVIVITFIVERKNAKDPDYWESRGAAAALTGLASLLLWVGIITAGRWIAYY